LAEPLDLDPRESLLALIEGRGPIDERFEQLRRLGPRGGDGNFSLVFTAVDRVSGRPVALKFFDPFRIMQEPYRWECFKREGEILVNLGSPPDIIGCVAPRSEFTETLRTEGGFTFPLTMSYIALEKAESTAAQLFAGDACGPVDRLLFFRAMCRGVQRLHSKAIAHRDLKPHNFLVMADNSLRLSDLGTACLLDGRARRLQADYDFHPGDYRYAAPEVIACLHDEDPRLAFGADMFALGAILFEIFAGAVLTLQVFDDELLAVLLQVPALAAKGHRRELYDRAVATLGDAHPLPSTRDYGPATPRSICDRLDGLYRSLAALDYRARLVDFDRVFNQIETCLLILRNDLQYRRWREQRQRRRDLLLAKLAVKGIPRP